MFDLPLANQESLLVEILLKNKNIASILDTVPFPNRENWYLGAGCVTQTVWNHLSGFDISNEIKDYDIVYYDAEDLSAEAEEKERTRIQDLLKHLPVDIDVVNEARVHLWYHEVFGKKIPQYKSCEDAISQWPTTASAIGINKIGEKVNIYAPYGLRDLLNMTVRANMPYTIKEVYEKKAERWKSAWPKLKVLSWTDVREV